MMFCSGFTRSRKAKISISWFFFTEGFVMGNWASLLPAVKALHRVSNASLGAALVAAVAGAVCSLPPVSSLCKRWGSGAALFLGALLTLLLFPIVGVHVAQGKDGSNIGDISVFVVGVFLLGFSAGWTDVSMNNQAVLCEKMTRLPTLGLFHCFYAIGGLFGALVGGVLLQRGMTVLGDIITICAVLLIPQVFFSCWLYSQQEEKLFSGSNVTMSQYGYGMLYEEEEKAASNGSIMSTPSSLSSVARDGNRGSNVEELMHTNSMIGLPTSDIITVTISPVHEPLLRSDSVRSSNSLSASHNNSMSDVGRQSSGTNSRQSTVSHSQPSHGSSGKGGSLGLEDPQTDWVVYEPKSSVDYSSLTIISAICFLGYFGYGSVGDWSAIYLTEDLDGDSLQSTFGYVGFSLFVALGTYGSDWFVMRFGRKVLLQSAGLLSALGLGIAVLAKSMKGKDEALYMAISGFSICGMGLSVVAPSVISLAGSTAVGMEPTDAIAFVSSIGYVGVMVGPPLLGGVAAILEGLRWSFAVDAVLMLLITLLASFIRVTRQQDPLLKPPGQQFQDETIQ